MMAGSYRHVLGGWHLVENMGDAWQTVHELFWLVESQIGRKKAKQLLSQHYYPMLRNEKKKDAAFLHVQKKMEFKL